MELTDNLQKWLKQRVSEEGKNQAELSNETGISQSTWSRLLNNKGTSIDADTVIRLCRKYNLTKLDLFFIAEKGMLFFIPIGTIIGIIFIIGGCRLGYNKKKVWACESCGYFFERA